VGKLLRKKVCYISLNLFPTTASWISCFPKKIITQKVKVENKTDRQRTYNKTLKAAFVQPLLQGESNKYSITWVCVCSLECAACNAHAPYFSSVSCPVLQYFSTLSHTRNNFRGGGIAYGMFWFSLQLHLKHSHFKNLARYDQNITFVFMYLTVILVRF